MTRWWLKWLPRAHDWTLETSWSESAVNLLTSSALLNVPLYRLVPIASTPLASFIIPPPRPDKAHFSTPTLNETVLITENILYTYLLGNVRGLETRLE